VNPPAVYTPGHTADVTAFMARRSATSHAAFVLPHLRPDWRVLDLGCGPGSITTDLGTCIPRGSIVGVDMHPGQIAHARELARARGTSNVEFAVMSVESLTFPLETFDLIFAHAVIEHLGAPVDALRELRRFLKPGGLIALRSPDWGGLVLHPDAPGLVHALAAYEGLQKNNGGDLRAGRKLGAWLKQAGFTAVRRSASYQIYEHADEIASYLADQLERAVPGDAGPILRTWAQEPDAVFAQAWFEAIGDKPAKEASIP